MEHTFVLYSRLLVIEQVYACTHQQVSVLWARHEEELKLYCDVRYKCGWEKWMHCVKDDMSKKKRSAEITADREE